MSRFPTLLAPALGLATLLAIPDVASAGPPDPESAPAAEGPERDADAEPAPDIEPSPDVPAPTYTPPPRPSPRPLPPLSELDPPNARKIDQAQWTIIGGFGLATLVYVTQAALFVPDEEDITFGDWLLVPAAGPFVVGAHSDALGKGIFYTDGILQAASLTAGITGCIWLAYEKRQAKTWRERERQRRQRDHQRRQRLELSAGAGGLQLKF